MFNFLILVAGLVGTVWAAWLAGRIIAREIKHRV